MKAERIVSEAENERRRLLDEANLKKEIEDNAIKYKEQVIEECEAIRMKAFNEAEGARLAAQEEAIKIKEDSQAYAQQVLGKLEGDLKQLYQVVMNGQQFLQDMQYQNDHRNH